MCSSLQQQGGEVVGEGEEGGEFPRRRNNRGRFRTRVFRPRPQGEGEGEGEEGTEQVRALFVYMQSV